MPIHRTKREHHFTTFSNELIQREDMDYGARGLLEYMLSLPDDWVFYESDLVKRSPNEGKQRIHNYIKQITDKGYLVKRQDRDENGKFSGKTWELFDTPRFSPTVQFPTDGNPTDGKPTDGNQQLQNTHLTKNPKNKVTIDKNTCASGDDASVLKTEFEKLWSNYPNKKGKQQAFNHYKAWRKKSKKHTYAYIAHKLDDYLNYLRSKNTPKQYIMYGSTWFNGRFEDELDIPDYSQPKKMGYSELDKYSQNNNNGGSSFNGDFPF